MRKILPILLVFYILLLISTRSSQASLAKDNLQTTVRASVGEYYLNLSGYISPFASVVLTSDGTFLRSAVADSTGNFYISQVLISKGFSNFCLEAVDFNRIGSSTTCFSLPPATGSITMSNIFLPPTLGLAKSEIAAGKTAIAFGYTMPGAKVTLYLSDGRKLTTTADLQGYYSFNIEDLAAGKYELYGKAEYEGKESLTPTKRVSLHALSWWEQLLAFLRELWERLMKFLTSISLGPLWLGLPILILIIILIVKIRGGKLFATVPFSKEEKLLHHAWFVGY